LPVPRRQRKADRAAGRQAELRRSPPVTARSAANGKTRIEATLEPGERARVVVGAEAATARARGPAAGHSRRWSR
jgi:hypothetical protein